MSGKAINAKQAKRDQRPRSSGKVMRFSEFITSNTNSYSSTNITVCLSSTLSSHVLLSFAAVSHGT